MAEKKIGTCNYCGKELSKIVLKKHFQNCEKKPSFGTEQEDFFLIAVEGYHDNEYWLYIREKTNFML